MPCGKDSQGLPIGVQILAKPFDEVIMLRVGNFIEKIKNGQF